MSPSDAGTTSSTTHPVSIARALLRRVREGAVSRDREGRIEVELLEELARSGLLACTVPAAGERPTSVVQLVEAFRAFAAADPSVAQVLLPHFVLVDAVHALGSPTLKGRLLDDVRAGHRVGNAISERGTKHAWDPQTRLTPTDDPEVWRLNGRKYYSTGALSAHWIGVLAKDPQGRNVIAFIKRDDAGLTLTADWTAFGQRATVSGPAMLDDVRVPREHVLDVWRAFEGPTLAGAFDQLLHIAIDVGIARGALDEGAAFGRTKARAWFESGLSRAAEEREVIQRVGQLASNVLVAEQSLRQVASDFDALRASELTDDNTAQQSIATAALKVFASRTAVEVASSIFEITGTSGTDQAHDLDRHWRNARTHTLHDPIRWKEHHVGNFVLNAVNPPRHSLV